jgi:hypothetical protein
MTAILGKARHWTKLGWIAKNSLNKINLTKIGMSANCPKATLYVQKYLNGQKKRSIDFYIAPYQKAKNQSGRGRVKFIFNPQYLQAQNHIYLSVRL